VKRKAVSQIVREMKGGGVECEAGNVGRCL
jgi:hypothetical protein